MNITPRLFQEHLISVRLCTEFNSRHVYWLVNKHGRGVGPRRLQVLHCIPLVNAALVWGDAAFIVSHPGERHASRKIIIPTWQFANLVQHLQGWPIFRLCRNIWKTELSFVGKLVLFKGLLLFRQQGADESGSSTKSVSTVLCCKTECVRHCNPRLVHYSPHNLHWHRFEDMSAPRRVYSEAPGANTIVGHSLSAAASSTITVLIRCVQQRVRPSLNSPITVQMDLCVAPQRQHHSNWTAFAGRRENNV